MFMKKKGKLWGKLLDDIERKEKVYLKDTLIYWKEWSYIVFSDDKHNKIFGCIHMLETSNSRETMKTLIEKIRQYQRLEFYLKLGL